MSGVAQMTGLEGNCPGWKKMGLELSGVAQMTGGELSRVEKDGRGIVWCGSNDRRGIVRIPSWFILQLAHDQIGH